MHALLIVDRLFAEHERSLIERLEIGLADEGVEVSIAVPNEIAATGSFDLLGEALGYRPSGFGPVRKLSAQRLIREMTARDERRPPDVVHAFGGKCWDLGAEIARQAGASLVFELWRAGLVGRARSFRPPKGVKFAVAVPDGGIEREILREGHGIQARLARWGGVVPPERSTVLREGRQIGLVMVGNGGDVAGCRAAFDGAAQVLREHERAMLFLDGRVSSRAGLWKRARDAGVDPRISAIDRLEERRDLTLRCDMLIYPESRQEHRTILLDAMGAGLPVVAAKDESVSALIHDQTARIVDGHDPETWKAEIDRLLSDADAARALGQSARAYIRESQRWSGYVASISDLYEWLTDRGLRGATEEADTGSGNS